MLYETAHAAAASRWSTSTPCMRPSSPNAVGSPCEAALTFARTTSSLRRSWHHAGQVDCMWSMVRTVGQGKAGQ